MGNNSKQRTAKNRRKEPHYDSGDRTDTAFYRHRDTGRGTKWREGSDTPLRRTHVSEVLDLILPAGGARRHSE